MPNAPPKGGTCFFKAFQSEDDETERGLINKPNPDKDTVFIAGKSKVEFSCSGWEAAEHDRPLRERAKCISKTTLESVL